MHAKLQSVWLLNWSRRIKQNHQEWLHQDDCIVISLGLEQAPCVDLKGCVCASSHPLNNPKVWRLSPWFVRYLHSAWNTWTHHTCILFRVLDSQILFDNIYIEAAICTIGDIWDIPLVSHFSGAVQLTVMENLLKHIFKNPMSKASASLIPTTRNSPDTSLKLSGTASPFFFSTVHSNFSYFRRIWFNLPPFWILRMALLRGSKSEWFLAIAKLIGIVFR